MTADTITAAQFHVSDGIEDWRVLYNGAHAHFETETFARSVELVAAIGALPGVDDRRPEVNLCGTGVSIGLTTRYTDGLTQGDVDLARAISDAARDVGAVAEPSEVQVVEIAIQSFAAPNIEPFWRAILGWQERGPWDLFDSHGRGPTIALQPIEEPRRGKGRIHVDISVPHDQAEARIAAAIEAGGSLVTDEFAPRWWVLADADGNEACIATWVGRE